MPTLSAPAADEPRASIPMGARLDAMTRQKVDDLARHFTWNGVPAVKERGVFLHDLGNPFIG